MKCDAKTFARMYEEIYKDLYRYALCILRNPQEAEDAVSEAVISAYENIQKLRVEAAFKSWMYTILTNICKKRLKKAAKELHKEWDVSEELGFCEELDYGRDEEVRQAFFVLSEEEKMIVGMSVFGGYNSVEIGKMLGMKPNTVRSRRSRALQKMKCVLS